MAIGVLSELDRLGLRAGRDLSVVGYDDIAEAARANPPLTTMAINPKRHFPQPLRQRDRSRITGAAAAIVF